MYYHGVINGLVDKKIIDILERREICSTSRMGYSKRIGFNENDYVCICENLGDDFYLKYPNNAFNKYVFNHFCFLIDGNIDVIRPEVLDDIGTLSPFDLIALKNNNPNKRFTDLPDELQVQDKISFDNVVGIGIPYGLSLEAGFIKLSNFCFLTQDEFLELIKKIEDIANSLGIMIVDSGSSEFKHMSLSSSNKAR